MPGRTISCIHCYSIIIDASMSASYSLTIITRAKGQNAKRYVTYRTIRCRTAEQRPTRRRPFHLSVSKSPTGGRPVACVCLSVCLSVRLRRQFTARSHTHTHTRTLARRCRGTEDSERVARTIRHQIDVGSLATARQQQQQRCTGSPHSHPLPLTDSASSNTHYFFLSNVLYIMAKAVYIGCSDITESVVTIRSPFCGRNTI